MARFENMSERGRKMMTAVGLLIVVLLGYSIWANVRTPANSADFPGGLYWICKSCNNHIHKTVREYSDFQKTNYGEPVSCPKCNSTDTVRAIKCEKCGEYYPMERGQQKPCPKCGTLPEHL